MNLLIQQAGIAAKLDLTKTPCLQHDLPFRFQHNGVQIGTNCVALLDQIRNERAPGGGPAVDHDRGLGFGLANLCRQIDPVGLGIDHPLVRTGSQPPDGSRYGGASCQGQFEARGEESSLNDCCLNGQVLEQFCFESLWVDLEEWLGELKAADFGDGGRVDADIA